MTLKPPLRWFIAAPFLLLAVACVVLYVAPGQSKVLSIEDVGLILQLQAVALPYCLLVSARVVAVHGGVAGKMVVAFSRTLPGMVCHALMVAGIFAAAIAAWNLMALFGAVVLFHLLAVAPGVGREQRGSGALFVPSFLSLAACVAAMVFVPVPKAAAAYPVLSVAVGGVSIPGQAVLTWGAVHFCSIGLIGLFSGRILAGKRGRDVAAADTAAVSPETAAPPVPDKPRAPVLTPMVTALSRIIEALGIAIRLPVDVLTRLRHADQARCAVYGIILADMDPALHAAGIKAMVALEGVPAAVLTKRWFDLVRTLRREDRLPLLNLVTQTLGPRPREERRKFLANVERLVRSDRRFTLFEFALCTVLRSELDKQPVPPARAFPRTAVAEEMRVLLSVLARAGTGDPAQAELAFAKGMERFPDGTPGMVPATECSPDRLHGALETLRATSPVIKESILGALVECMVRDARIKPAEAELLTAMAAALGVGIPAAARPILAAAKRG